jgi:8-oxo-dGTP diphosphatase
MNPLLVTAAIIEHGGRILITLRRQDTHYSGYWEFPGGKMEPGEDPVSCVARELKEELDIAVRVNGIYDVIYHRYPEQTVMVLAYRCEWIGGEIADLEVAGHSWVLPAELIGYRLLPADLPLAERIAKEHVITDSAGI